MHRSRSSCLKASRGTVCIYTHLYIAYSSSDRLYMTSYLSVYTYDVYIYRYNKTAEIFDPVAKTVSFADGSVVRYNKVSSVI